MSILIITVALGLWGIVHSVLASHAAKNSVGFPRFYRLAYNIFAALSFAPIIYLWAALPDRLVYQIAPPWNLVMFSGQAVAVLLLLIAASQTDLLAFAGLRQLIQAESPGKLITGGLYRLVRHPLYSFLLLFLWLGPTMTQNALTVYIGSTVYILIGAYYEERKLLNEFGEAYAEYRRTTPMLIPGLIVSRK